MTKTALLFLLVLPACPPANSTSEGPEIIFRVLPSTSLSFTSTTLDPDLTRDPDTMNYEFTIQIQSSFGQTESGSKYTYATVTELEGNVTPPGIDLTVDDFMFDTSFDALRSRDFNSKVPIVIPGTMMGQMVTFKMKAIDTEGLESNVIDFSALLD